MFHWAQPVASSYISNHMALSPVSAVDFARHKWHNVFPRSWRGICFRLHQLCARKAPALPCMPPLTRKCPSHCRSAFHPRDRGARRCGRPRPGDYVRRAMQGSCWCFTSRGIAAAASRNQKGSAFKLRKGAVATKDRSWQQKGGKSQGLQTKGSLAAKNRRALFTCSAGKKTRCKEDGSPACQEGGRAQPYWVHRG